MKNKNKNKNKNKRIPPGPLINSRRNHKINQRNRIRVFCIFGKIKSNNQTYECEFQRGQHFLEYINLQIEQKVFS